MKDNIKALNLQLDDVRCHCSLSPVGFLSFPFPRTLEHEELLEVCSAVEWAVRRGFLSREDPALHKACGTALKRWEKGDNEAAARPLYRILKIARNIQENSAKARSTGGIDVDPRVLESYVGEYELGARGTVCVVRRDGRLALQAKGLSEEELVAETESRYYLPSGDLTLVFLEDEDTTLLLQQGGREIACRRRGVEAAG